MRKVLVITAVLLLAAQAGCAQQANILLDDFEGPLTGGPEGTVDFGAGVGSSLEVSAAQDIKQSGAQSLKAVYNAISGGYMWIARGYGLDAKNSSWLVKPDAIKWQEYNAISFYMYGSGSKARVAFDIKDSGGEISRFLVDDDFKGWKKIVCKFDQFFVRGDWQPDTADKNGKIDFPLKSYQIEPLPESKGTLYFDTVELTNAK